MMTTRTLRRSVALLSCLALFAGACSDSNDISDETSASDASSTTTDQPPISTGVAQCTVEDITPAVPEGARLDYWDCDQGWAAITYTADGTQETVAYQAEGQFWIAMPCDAEGVPESISDLAC